MSEALNGMTLQSILKKILLIVIGSGLLTNALYIYGLAYYEGYLTSLGFEYSFFPLKWEETLLWTYFASREFGASTVIFWTQLTSPIWLLIIVSSYFIARLWMAISAKEPPSKNNIRKDKFIVKILVQWRKKTPRLFKSIYPSLKWLLIMEQSVWAFLASYFVLIVILSMPLFIFIWVYFPLIGIHHGELTGLKRFEEYQANLCGGEDKYWKRCVELTTEHLKNEKLPPTIYGRVVIKHDSLIGLITTNVPVTITMPPQYFQQTRKNSNYKATSNK